MSEITLRPAVAADSDRLLAWRNDAETRANSNDTRPVERTGHDAWLKKVLADPAWRLFVAEADGRPVGTVRAVKGGDGWDLSWTVAPEARGRGFGRAMVRALIARLDGTVRAQVKRANGPSRRIAEAAGMTLEREDSTMAYFVAVHPDDG